MAKIEIGSEEYWELYKKFEMDEIAYSHFFTATGVDPFSVRWIRKNNLSVMSEFMNGRMSRNEFRESTLYWPEAVIRPEEMSHAKKAPLRSGEIEDLYQKWHRSEISDTKYETIVGEKPSATSKRIGLLGRSNTFDILANRLKEKSMGETSERAKSYKQTGPELSSNLMGLREIFNSQDPRINREYHDAALRAALKRFDKKEITNDEFAYVTTGKFTPEQAREHLKRQDNPDALANPSREDTTERNNLKKRLPPKLPVYRLKQPDYGDVDQIKEPSEIKEGEEYVVMDKKGRQLGTVVIKKHKVRDTYYGTYCTMDGKTSDLVVDLFSYGIVSRNKRWSAEKYLVKI